MTQRQDHWLRGLLTVFLWATMIFLSGFSRDPDTVCTNFILAFLTTIVLWKDINIIVSTEDPK